jgi:hypothetical protein
MNSLHDGHTLYYLYGCVVTNGMYSLLTLCSATSVYVCVYVRECAHTCGISTVRMRHTSACARDLSGLCVVTYVCMRVSSVHVHLVCVCVCIVCVSVRIMYVCMRTYACMDINVHVICVCVCVPMHIRTCT